MVPRAVATDGTLDPLGLLEDEHNLFLDICAAFETVADGLPDEADLGLAHRAAEILSRHQVAHYSDESEILFPALRSHVGPDHALARTLDLLEHQRSQDIDILAEIRDVLEAKPEGQRPANPGMFGYMLRAYFTCERRQIAWERHIVLPAARTLLTDDDIAALKARLSHSSRRQHTSQDILTFRRTATPHTSCWAGHTDSQKHQS